MICMVFIARVCETAMLLQSCCTVQYDSHAQSVHCCAKEAQCALQCVQSVNALVDCYAESSVNLHV